MTKNSVPGNNESLELYEQQLKQWGQQLVDRALVADFSGDDCAKVEKLVEGAIRAGVEAFSPETGKWSQQMFDRIVAKRAKSSTPHEVALVKTLLEDDGASLPAVSIEEPSPATEEANELPVAEGNFEQEFSKYSPDSRGALEQGEIVIFQATGGEEEWVFLGADAVHGKDGVFGQVRDGKLVTHRQPMSDFYDGAPATPTANFESTTNEPPEAIAGVSKEATLPPEAQMEKKKAEELNALKGKIDAQYDIIRAEKKDDEASRKKVAIARRMLDQLHQEAKNLADDLVGAGKLFELVKPADDVATKFYESKIPKKTSREERKKTEAELPEGAADAHYEAVRRKNDFAGVLGAKGIEKGIAYDLYREFLGRAKEVEWLKGELEGGRNDVLTGARARKALEWHGIKARQPELVLAELAPIIESYNTIPPKEDRPKREAPEKEGKILPLHERVRLGEVDIKTLPNEHITKLTTNKDESIKKIAEEEKERREAEKKEKTRKISPLLGRVLDALKEINDGKENITPPPDELLEKFANEPDVTAYLLLHPLAKTQSTPTIAKLSDRLMADLIDAGERKEPTAESRFEVRQALKQSKQGDQADVATLVEVVAPQVSETSEVSEASAKETAEAHEEVVTYAHDSTGYAALSSAIAELNKKLGYAAGDSRWKDYEKLDGKIKGLSRLHESFFSDVPSERTAVRPLLERRAQVIKRLDETTVSDEGVLISAVPPNEMRALFEEKEALEKEIVRLAYETETDGSIHENESVNSSDGEQGDALQAASAPRRPTRTEEEKNLILERFKKYLGDGTFRDGETYAMRNSAGEVVKGVFMYIGPEGKVRMYVDGKTHLCDPEELMELNPDVLEPTASGTPALSSETHEASLEGHYERARLRTLDFGKINTAKIRDQGLSPEDTQLIVQMLHARGVVDAEGNVVDAIPAQDAETKERERLLAEAQGRVAQMREQFGDGSDEVKEAVGDLYAIQSTAFTKEEDLPAVDRKDVLDISTPADEVTHDAMEKTSIGFDPERELEFILQLPKEERREKIKEYKVKLAWQRKGLARTQATAIEAIRENPNMTSEEFAELFGEQAAKFEASGEHYARAQAIFEKYKGKHEAVEKYYTEYPDPKDLFKTVFGIEAKEDVEVIKGPMTLYFRLKEGDYINAYGDAGLRENKIPSEESRKNALNTGGCRKRTSLIPELAGTLALELSTSKEGSGSDRSQEVHAHEEQHAINELFQEGTHFQRQDERFSKSWELIFQASSPVELRDAIVQYLRAWRGGGEDSGYASDEMFAFLRDGSSPDRILGHLTDTGRKIYNYFDKDKDSIRERIAELRKEKFTDEEKKIYDDVAIQVFEKEYKERITEGLTAYGELKKSGFSDEGVRAVLLHEPLQRWAKVVERVLNPGNVLPEAVVSGFEEQFGVEQQELLNIEGFKKLSEGQQLLVLKNLEQIALTDIKKEARAQQKEEWGKIPWYKKAWKQLYSAGMNPEHRIAELEKEILAKHRGGANEGPAQAKILAENLTNIEQLAKVAADGPEVNVNTDTGELEMIYVSGKDLFESDESLAIIPEQRKQFKEFNEVASEFAKFPREWGYETEKAGMIERWSGGRRRYEATKVKYATARANMLQLYRDRFAEEIAKDSTRSKEDPEKSAMRAMNAIDERMQLNQLFNSHPDAEAALQQVEDQNTVWAAAKEFWKSKGMFIAGGVLARWGTIAISGGIMLPAIGLIGAGVGGLIGTAEGKKLMKAKRTDGRMSEEDMREEITATNKDTGEVIRGADGKPLKREIKEFTDSAFFTDRVDRLTEKLWNTSEPAERALLEKKIAQTTALMSERFKRGMINFGGSSLEEGDERKGSTIANRLSFIQALAQGNLSASIDHEALDAEIERITGLRQSTIEDKRKKEVIKTAAKSAVIRGAFALTGAGIAQGVKEILPPFSQDQAEAVANTIRRAPNNTGLPNELVMSGRNAEIKGFEDYMRDWNPFTRAQTAEVMGMTKEQMDAKIAELLAKGHHGASEVSGVIGKTEHVAPSTVRPPATGTPSYADADPDSYDPEAFKPENFDKNIPDVVGRTPSAEELSALRSTGGVDVHASANMDQHNALIIEMKKSGTPLTHEQIEAILGKEHDVSGAVAPGGGSERAEEMARLNAEAAKDLGVRSSAGGVAVAGNELAHGTSGGELLQYKVVSGDNLTKILKTNIPELKDLSPHAQENAIQNLLKSLSPEELKAIGISDPNKLGIGQTLDLNKITQLLHEKKIGGEDLLERAKHFGEQPPANVEADHFNPDQVKAVGDAIRSAPNTTGLPNDAVMSGREAFVRGVEDYMKDTNPAHRAQTLEVLGMTKEQMDAQIAGSLAKGHAVHDAIPHPAGTPFSMEETTNTWKNLPDGLKVPQAQLEASRYLDADIEKLFPKPLFAPASPEWLSLRDRDALSLLNHDGQTHLQTLFAGTTGIPKGYELSATTKIQQYITEQGLIWEKGYIPMEKETLGDFLKRALAEKVLHDGPSRPFVQGRILH